MLETCHTFRTSEILIPGKKFDDFFRAATVREWEFGYIDFSGIGAMSMFDRIAVIVDTIRFR